MTSLTDTNTTEDTGVLERLDFDAELKCEAGHVSPDNKTCSVSAVAVTGMRCINWTVFACANHVAFYVACINDGTYCNTCRRPCSDCWQIIPIAGSL